MKKIISIIIILLILILLELYFNQKVIHFNQDGKYYLTENVFIVCTSKYEIWLETETDKIDPYISEVATHEKYIIIKRKELIKANNYNSYMKPGKETTYYLIDRKSEEIIGPLSEKEYKKYELKKVSFKLTSL